MIVYIKVIGGGMVIISSILLSAVLCNSEAAKLSVLNGLVNVFSQISGDIRLGFSNLPAAFKNVYEHSENELVINLFKALCDDLDDKENDNFSTVFNKNIDKFFKVVDECKGRVELVTGEGDRLNLKSKLSQYVSLANIFSGGEIPELEIVAYEKEDIDKLLSFMING